MNFTRHLTALRNRGRSVRAYIMTIVAVVLVPGLTIGGSLVYEAALSQRHQTEGIADREVRELTTTINREVAANENMLRALASAHHLQSGDLAAFHRQIVELATLTNTRIILADPARGLQLAHSALEFGRPVPRELPPQRMEAEQQALQSGQPVLSDVYHGPNYKQFTVAVVMPVPRANDTPYALALAIPAETFANILYGIQTSPEWVTSIIDRRNVIVARSEKHEEFAGTQVFGNPRRPPDQSEGVSIVPIRDGRIFRWTWKRSQQTGWIVSVGVPEAVLNAPVRQAMTAYAAVALLLFAAGLGLSYHFAGRIERRLGVLGIDREPTREEFDILFESNPSGVVVVDRDGKIVLANSRVEAKFGYSRNELIGKPMGVLCPRHAPPGASGRSVLMALPNEIVGVRKDGTEFPLEVAQNEVQTRSGRFTILILINITERKRAAQELERALAERDELRRRLMQAQEAERLRLAHELHDQTGQSLAAAMLDLKSLEPQTTEAGRARLRGLRAQLEAMGKALHRVAHELRPASIDELGLASALSTYVADWSAQFGIEVDFHCRDARVDSLPDDVRTTLYRVVQEALTNIAKHAPDASTVSVVIDRSDTMLQLTVEDNGRGFEAAPANDTGRPKKGPGLGHAGMRERLALIGGELEIESTVGLGTTIYARVPLQQERLTA